MVHEIKFDGYRVEVHITDSAVTDDSPRAVAPPLRSWSMF